jgi:anti-sigma factor RsiW
MDYEAQLKLQAYLDGELPEGKARQMASLLAKDKEAAALSAELRNTREALAGFETGIRVPESREFYWSKIARQIKRVESVETRPAPAPAFVTWLRRLLMPAAVAAFATVIVLVANRPVLPGEPDAFRTETALADSGAFTYHDYAAGTTLVWLSYPADNEVAEGDEMGTLE